MPSRSRWPGCSSGEPAVARTRDDAEGLAASVFPRFRGRARMTGEGYLFEPQNDETPPERGFVAAVVAGSSLTG